MSTHEFELEPLVAPLTATKDDPTAAERQRRYRKRHGGRKDARNGRNASPVTRDGAMVLCASQERIEISFGDEGNAAITQSSWPDQDQTIVISRDNIDEFIDRRTDALSIPSIGRP